MSEEIVIIARYDSLGSGTVFTTNYNNNGGVLPEAYYGYSAVGGENDSSHQQDAILAANNVALAIGRIVSALKGVSVFTPIEFPDGKFISAGDILSSLSSIKFVVTDVDYSSMNGGVGASDFINQTDYMDYTAFMPGTGWGAHGESAMNGIIAHEIGHMTQARYDNQQNEAYWQRQENATNHQGYAPFYPSYYAIDNEAYADSFVQSVGERVGLSVATYLGLTDLEGTFRGGASIYDENVIHSRMESDSAASMDTLALIV